MGRLAAGMLVLPVGRTLPVLLFGVALGTAVACASARPVSLAGCSAPNDTILPVPSPPADSLVGEYRLTLVASTGPRHGHASAGALALRRGADSLRGVYGPYRSFPLYGWSDIDLKPVGGVQWGDLSSHDSVHPGVLVWEAHWPAGYGPRPTAQHQIALRLGSHGNSRDSLFLDAPYTQLTVTEIGASGFSGTWTAGGAYPSPYRASGFFCAVRPHIP